MNRLWAPWREKYITGLQKKESVCIFCRMLRQNNDAKNFIFARRKHSFAVLNLFPYNNGHILVVPNKHVKDLKQLSKDEKLDLLELFEDAKDMVDKVLKPHGYNVGINLGRVAGAGFPGHLHIHVVPRWGGDVNFMPIIGDTKVVSQSLKVLCGKLKKCAREKKSKN